MQPLRRASDSSVCGGTHRPPNLRPGGRRLQPARPPHLVRQRRLAGARVLAPERRLLQPRVWGDLLRHPRHLRGGLGPPRPARDQ
nr:MAG TPA: hypothetical protein [Caudoviricetes sp.]